MNGKTFGKWTVIDDCDNNIKKVVCKCECGTEKLVTKNNLVRGKTKSCGCYRKEYLSDLKTNGGRDNKRLYAIWCKMKDRCYNSNVKDYANYGGRGITVCDEWKNDFPKFLEWANDNNYTDELTIDRIDNNKGYSPDNCRWATRKEQNRNKRNVRYIEIEGVTKSVSEWAEYSGISRKTLQSRIKYGWQSKDLLMKPSWKRRDDR